MERLHEVFNTRLCVIYLAHTQTFNPTGWICLCYAFRHTFMTLLESHRSDAGKTFLKQLSVSIGVHLMLSEYSDGKSKSSQLITCEVHTYNQNCISL